MNYTDLPNLVSPQLNGCIIFATDEWFAAADNMIKDDEPVWKEGLYTTYGKWMDGWESRRRRTAGHDWCIVQLGIAGVIRAIEVDTAYFTGNFSPKVSIQGCCLEEKSSLLFSLQSLRQSITVTRPEDGKMGTCATQEEWDIVSQLKSENWNMLVPLTPLGAGYEATRKTIFEISNSGILSHLRVNMGPDGGIARIRVYGEVSIKPESIPFDKDIDLAKVEIGGLAVAWSNMHYGHPRNLIAPGRGTCMGDGWETARQPKRPAVYTEGPDGLIVLPGFDWAILKLGISGIVSKFEVDTNFYKGNYPESCMIEGCYEPNKPLSAFKRDYESDKSNESNDNTDNDSSSSDSSSSIDWKIMLRRTRLSSSAVHSFPIDSPDFQQIGPVTHVRITIYPDGGVMRLRVYGRKHSTSRL